MENSGSMMNHGHSAVDRLINTAEPTHIAVRDGAWSEADTWQGGEMPGRDASVLIDAGATVTYDLEISERIKVIAIRGGLAFATDRDTELIVETILNAPEGRLDIGSEAEALGADKQARIIFASDRTIDTQWDPTQLTKGLVSHGEVNIYGAEKLDAVALVGDASAGDSVLTFAEPLSGWQVGDRIVLGGTQYNYYGDDADNSRFQDEVLEITAINGNQVEFINEDITSGATNVLRYDHARSNQVDVNDLTLYAGNLSRNVSFATEKGKAVPIEQRGHVMLMHNPNVNVVNAGFYDLGRSDKTQLVDDPQMNFDGTPGNGTNPRGRYSLHLHRMGADDLGSRAAIIRGNAIAGSPGWGLVQHDSHAGLEDNVVFDAVGAGIAAESGNEIGWWTNNLVVKTTGIPFDQAVYELEDRERLYDFGTRGDGFWIQGAAQVQNQGNKAISSNRVGMAVFASPLTTARVGRDVETIQVSNLAPELQGLFPAGQTEVDIRDVPGATISGFESYNAETGLQVWGRQTNFDGELEFSSDVKTAHEGRSLVEDFKLWGNRASGATVEYSTNIDLKNGVIIRQDSNGPRDHRGIFRNAAAMGGSFENITISGFEQAIEMEMPNARNDDKDFFTASLTNNRFVNNDYNFSKVGDKPVKDGRADDFSAHLRLVGNEFGAIADNALPEARFSATPIGGRAVKLDASASSDADPLRPEDGAPLPLASSGIAAYGWDVDGDGTIDRWGREVDHVFDSEGAKNVTLTVFDGQGAAAVVQQTVEVDAIPYANAFADGDLDPDTLRQNVYRANSQWSDKGWFVDGEVSFASGYGQLSKEGDYSNTIGQVTRNQKVHRGQQELSFRLKNIEGGTENNRIEVSLWGIDGQFDYNPFDGEGPRQVGTLPMARQMLASSVIGDSADEFFDWQDISLDADLGEGYDYLLVQVSAKATRNAGDDVAIDDISLSSPTAIQPLELPDSVSKLDFDRGRGRRVADSSVGGVENIGILRRDAWTEGVSGSAAALNGDTDRILIRNSNDINLGTHPELTVSVWFKADDVTGSTEQMIYDQGSAGRGLNMYVKDSLLYFGGWNRAESRWRGDWESTAVSAGEWHHAALVLDGGDTVQPNSLTAYLNGAKVGEMDGSQLWNQPGATGLGNVVGRTRFQDGSLGARDVHGFAGAIDEVEIFNDALSGEQVQQLATAFG